MRENAVEELCEALHSLVMGAKSLLAVLVVYFLVARPAESCQTPPPSRDPSTWTCVEDDEADFFYCNTAIRINQCETNEDVRNRCKATCGVCKLEGSSSAYQRSLL